MDDMQTMQMDNSSEIAKLLVPYLLKIDVEGQLRTRGAAAARGLGLHPGRRLGARRLLQRRLAQHALLAFGNKLPKELRVKGDCLNVRALRRVRPRRRPGRRHPPGARVRHAGRRSRRSRTAATAGTRSCGSSSRTPTATGGRPAAPRPVPGDRDRDELLAHAMKNARWELTVQARQGHRHLELGTAAPPDAEEPDHRHGRPGLHAVAPQPRPLGPGRRQGRGQRHRLERRRAATT